MKKFNAINKRNQKAFVLTFLEDGKVLALDLESGKEKGISAATVKRWYEVGAEVESNEPTIFDLAEEVEEVKEEVKNVYTYVYRLRGFSLGCQPKGFISHNDNEGRHGSVTYDRALTKKEMDDYELILLDVNEDKKEKDSKHSRSSIKKDGSVRNDKFRPKLDSEQAYDILVAYHDGSKKSHIAKEYGVSFRTITCIVEGLMWKDVYAKFHTDLNMDSFKELNKNLSDLAV